MTAQVTQEQGRIDAVERVLKRQCWGTWEGAPAIALQGWLRPELQLGTVLVELVVKVAVRHEPRLRLAHRQPCTGRPTRRTLDARRPNSIHFWCIAKYAR